MKINDNESATRKIYLKDLHQWVSVSKTDFDNYYRDINTYRRRQQEHGRCVCPASKRYLCDMDCCSCRFHKGGDSLSLDYTVTDDDGNEKSWLDDLPDDRPSTQSVMEDRELLGALLHKLDELDPEGRRICELVMEGRSERDCGKEMGIARNTFVYKRDKLFATLADYLKDFI
jgi:DNA-directed RNA polymerase specialized sigma24 family protein